MEFEDILVNRESVRMFKDDQISEEQLVKILNAGRLAPTAKNIQAFKVYVIQSEEKLKLIDEVTPCRFNAKTVLLICTNKEISYHNSGWSSEEVDGSIVGTFMMLEATNVGVDNIWLERFDKEKVLDLLNIDKVMNPVLLMPLGYRKDEYLGSPNKGKRKPLNDLVERI